jgi:hypothetical protein
MLGNALQIRSFNFFFAATALLCTTGTIARATPTVSFTAQFHEPGNGLVQIDFVDENNIALTATGTQNQTLVVDGQIYLLLPARTPYSETTGLLHIGSLVVIPKAPRPVNATAPTMLRATRTPAAVRAAWGNLNSLHDVSIDRAGPIGIPIDLTIAARSPLASAQFAIHQRLRPAMDMAICGDAINNLTAWWPPTLTGAGYGIIAITAGIRLDGPIHPLGTRPALPKDVAIQDYRRPSAIR